MNWDQLAGDWKEMKGRVRSAWGKLTDDDLEQAAGDREILEGRLQERYGKTKEEARKAVDDLLSSL